MSQAEQSSPAGAPAVAPLWGGYRIPIILLSGEVNSGKSIFQLLIDGACRTQGHEPTTRIWDQEGSCDSYVGSLNFDRKDVRDAVNHGVHRMTVPAAADAEKWRRILLEKADVNDSPSASMFRAWYLSLLNTPAGKFRVGCVDTWTPLQEGLIEWLKLHPDAFNRTAGQYEKASSMFLWPDVKSVMSYILATDCRLRFETFVMTVHLKNEWSGQGQAAKKTGERIAEGLDVLDKLCTLHLRLDRTPKSRGKEAPRVPSATVMKERLIFFGATPSDDKPILPPRLPEATPDAIREYIAKGGVDFSNLSAGERAPDNSPTEDQIRQMDMAKVADQRAYAEANVEAEKLHMTRLQMMQQAYRQTSPTDPTGTGVAGVAQPAEQSPTVNVVTANVPQSNSEAFAELMVAMKVCFASGELAKQWFGEYFGGIAPPQLSMDQIAGGMRALSELRQKRAAEKLAASGTTPTTMNEQAAIAADAQVDNAAAVTKDSPSTDAQRQKIRVLSEGIGMVDSQHVELLRTRWGVASYRSLTVGQIDERIQELEAKLADPNATPFG